MKMAQRNSSTTAPTSTTCAHTGITSFADGGKPGIGDCGGGAGGVNGLGGVGGGGDVGGVGDGGGGGGVDGLGGAGGDEGQAEERSNRAMTLPGEFAFVGGPILPADQHLRATDAGNMMLGAALPGAMLAVSGGNLGPPAMQCARNCSLACPGSYPRRLYRSLTTLGSALGKIRPRRASSGGARLC